MSRILWTHAVTPPEGAVVEDRVYDVYDPPLVVSRTRAFPQPARRLAELPDRRAYRALSRAGILLAAAGLQARDALAPFLARDRYRVGIYCAADPGPQNYAGTKSLLGVHEGFAEAFRRRNHPKIYFTQLANLPAARLAVFLDLRGPINVYNHSTAAAIQALEQAEIELAAGFVDAALVCSAFSLEDPLLSLRVRRQSPSPILSEGAGAMVLTADGALDERIEAIPGDRDVCYGVADPILQMIRKEGL